MGGSLKNNNNNSQDPLGECHTVSQCHVSDVRVMPDHQLTASQADHRRLNIFINLVMSRVLAFWAGQLIDLIL